MSMAKTAKILGDSDLCNVNNILQVVTSTVKAKPSHDNFQDENSSFNGDFLTLNQQISQ